MSTPSSEPGPPTDRELALLLPEGRTWSAPALAAFRLDAEGLCVFACGGRAPRFGQEPSPEWGHRPDCMLVRLVKEIRRLRAGQFYPVEDEDGEPREVLTPLAMIEEIRRLRSAESEIRNLIANETGGRIDVVDEDTHEDASVPEMLGRLLEELRSEEWLVRAAEEIGQVHWGGLDETVRATLVLGILRRHRGDAA
ncbi:MAG TPA: hypothetical protein VFK70_04365 [Vicinamibacteria bacterium]|nr:hypothetical protein [Vicinamibacteria bacterium]